MLTIMRALLLSLLLVLPAWAGAININTATASELDAGLDGIGPQLADRIIDYRQRHGAFKRPEDLQKVPYVGTRRFQKNRDRIRVDG